MLVTHSEQRPLRRPYDPCVQEPLTDVLIFLRADVAAVGRTGGRVLDAGTVELRVHKSAVNRTKLDAGQMALVRSMCTSGAHGCSWRLPGRRRETTGMRTLVKAWGDSGGQPSAWAFLAVATSEGVVSGTSADLEPYIPRMLLASATRF